MQPTFGQILRVFITLGLTSFGGGRSAYYYEAFVARRRWVKTPEFLQDLTLSQIIPGPNVTNLAVAMGYRLAGLAGAASAFVAVIVPGAVALLVLTTLYFHGSITPGAQSAIRGGGAAVAGVVVVTTLKLGSTLRGWRTVAIAGAAFAAVGLLRLNSVAAILVVGALSLWLHRPRS